MLRYLFSFLLFFYIYPVKFNFIPFGLSTRIILSLFGVAYVFNLCLNLLSDKRKLPINRRLFKILVLLLLISLISVFSLMVNNTRDLTFVTLPGSILLIICSAVFLMAIFKKISYQHHNPIELLIRYIVLAVFLQNCIAFLMFINPTFLMFITKIQNINDLDQSRLFMSVGIRFIGLGSSYFGAGIINGLALIFLSFLIKTEKKSIIHILKLTFQYIVILGFGMMMARTTILGFVIGLMILFFPLNLKISKKRIRNKFAFFSSIAAIVSLCIFLLFYIFPHYFKIIDKAFSFGFEMFFNYSKNGSFKTTSTTQMMDMYVVPDNFKTWLIGDGRFVNPSDPLGYYHNTDIGHLRLIYYFGLIGSLAYFYFQYYSTRIICTLTRDMNQKFIFFMLFLYVVVLNFKGFADLFFIFILFILLVVNVTTDQTSQLAKA